ncbi:fatty acyl-AMP ligase [Streptomyces sp. DSM 44917]|uniref:Fatty acyl-AMP ligase n=1 Tax=Streptomyces boetiae TaxID=3075541 RepID=A0ABU2L4M4_9ACTN|nr:fatty acyl-AMP ligase [Streptomyces sp. DSM 44917]MDT0306371.1 fatty acyl-AMP ligase [Streptomyces sp. DSM 44917]
MPAKNSTHSTHTAQETFREETTANAYRPLTESLREWAGTRGHQRAFTFVEYPGPDSPGVHRTLTWQRLYQRAQAVAAGLRETARPGDRAALMLPQGLDYVTAFLGCLYARVIAVPLFSPDLPGHEGRLAAVLDDCEAAVVLSDTATAGLVREFGAAHGMAADVTVLAVDQLPVPEELPAHEPAPEADEIAYLQYTSGSTRLPAGVMISHGNVAANAEQAIAAFDADADRTTCVGWLPLFHDMGLVLSVAAPVSCGFPSVLMDPVAFLERPVRWLKLLGGYRGTVSAAPNFAFDYAASRVSAEEAADLRLDRVRTLINGSEPVRTGTIDRFLAAFGDTGLPPEAHCPSYGLAEATVFVSADPLTELPHAVTCDRDALTHGRIVPPPADDPEAATELVACGVPAGQEIAIADPDTGAALPEGSVGEIRLRGPNIGLGYWKRPEQSAETFGSPLAGGSGAWLRTGDLGALHEGQLLVTGRLKDLIIVDGRNHYPQDVEETVQAAVAAVRRDRLAAFDAGDGRVVVVAEHRREVDPTPELRAAATETARAQVSVGHGVRLARLLLVEPGAVPRTSSGKVSRSACRAQYLAGAFAGVEGANA